MPSPRDPAPHRFPRPRILISRCITFDAVRYDGSVIPSGIVEAMKPFVDFIPVCPEVEIGLPVPRDPIRIVRTAKGDQLVQPSTGVDLTGELETFAREYLDHLSPVDGFILKSRSPSCAKGGAKVYPSADASSHTRRGPGLFGRAVIGRFGRFPVVDEEGLRDRRIRDRFLTAVFTLARFRVAKEGGKVRDLARFHAETRVLVPVSRRASQGLERLVTNPLHRPPREVFAQYGDLLLAALRRLPRSPATMKGMLPAREFLPYPAELDIPGEEAPGWKKEWS